MTIPKLEKLIWVLIYGGIIFLSLGLFVEDRDSLLGWAMVVGGVAASAVGGVLVYVRSRMKA